MTRALHAHLVVRAVVVSFCGGLGCATAHAVRMPTTLVAIDHSERTDHPDATDTPPSRDAVVAYARRYVDLRWDAAPEHVFHATFDAEALRIDTPDDTFVRGGWSVGANVGMPYSWGGFDTPEDFVRKIDDHRPAGYVERTRAARGSAYAAGIDCSGLVSRSWRLPRKYSTAQLPTVGTPLDDLTQLMPGDVLDKPNGHALLFVRFGDPTRTTVDVIEAGAWDGRAWKVVESTYTTDRLTHDGFFPLRDKRRAPGT